MQSDFHLSDALNAKPIVVQLDAVPVTWERDAVETAARLESRKGLLAEKEHGNGTEARGPVVPIR